MNANIIIKNKEIDCPILNFGEMTHSEGVYKIYQIYKEDSKNFYLFVTLSNLNNTFTTLFIHNGQVEIADTSWQVHKFVRSPIEITVTFKNP